MNEKLIQYLKLNTSLNNDQLQKLTARFERRELQPGRFLLKKGQIADTYFFIEDGYLRSFYINGEKEHTVWIEAPGELTVEIKSLRLQQPTEYNIVAIEPVTYYAIKAVEWDKLISEFETLQEFMLRLWETRFIIAVDGLRAFQTLDAKGRYEYLLKNFPNFEKLPQHQLANILGITQYSLSRIRRQK
ncbi:MAG: Crp/Fnr family transcriptional regulator [Fluviicola sp.]|jgi:CRP-like cAMP-binding protein|uniref:Crp/Fnr family transcriptional regulator n=1 Tax=Fluviicola sp. TaxID=1917219 RepID=UPI002611DFCB|nr:Crp/Fnr family transcriptional regulator [Fluviicola sp.]MDF3026018.1 Crp/Fnr family transcriptional regulator [Fluviicola sp.]